METVEVWVIEFDGGSNGWIVDEVRLHEEHADEIARRIAGEGGWKTRVRKATLRFDEVQNDG